MISTWLIAVALNPQTPLSDWEVPTATQVRPGPPKASDWKTEVRLRGELRYDSNVWLLDQKRQDRLTSNTSGDQVSGRFKDMESVEDVILSPDARFHVAGPSPLGRRLSFWVEGEYHYYPQNVRRSHFETSVWVGQYLGSDGHLQLTTNVVPRYFQRNYLVDAVDLSGDGSISSSERRYEHADYFEWNLALEYRHHIIPRTKTHPFGWDGVLSTGYLDRDYGAGFPGRDGAGAWTQLALRFEYGSGFKWGVRYKYESLWSPTRREVQILDEPDFGVDFNGNGNVTDQNARSFESVSRSRVDHEIGVSAGVDLSSSVELAFFFTRTIRVYASKEPFDVAHRARQDDRDDVGASIRYRFAKGWEGRFGARWRQHDTNRSADPDIAGDTFDYMRYVVFLSVDYRW